MNRGRYSPLKITSDNIVDGSIQVKDLHSSLEGTGGVNSPIPLKIITCLQSDEVWSGSPSFNTTKFVPGLSNRSMIINPSGGGTQTNDLTIESIHDATAGITIRGNLHHWFWCSDWSKIDRLDVRLMPDKESLGTYWGVYAVLADVKRFGGIDGEWTCIIAKPWSSDGGSPGAWSHDGSGETIENIRIYCTANAAVTVELYYGGTVEEDWPKAAICLGLDGVYREAVDNALPPLDALGYKACLYPVAYHTYDAGTSTAGRMNTSELLTYYNKGWDVIPHGWTTTFTSSTTEANMVKEIIRAMKWGSRCGFHRGTHIGSPIGSSGICDQADAREIAKNYYFASRQRWRMDSVYGTSDEGYPIVPPKFSWMKPDYMAIKCDGWHEQNVAFNKDLIDQLVGCRGFLHMYTHKVMDGPSGNDITPEHWQELLDHISAYVRAGTLEVITLTEYLNRTLYRVGPMYADERGGVYIRTTAAVAADVDQQLS